jgi:SAM-dependent methyltransferase
MTSQWGDGAAWDRLWSSNAYGNPRVRAERARIKIAAAVELGLVLAESDHVLDLACGTADSLIEASERGSRRACYVGSDISAVALGRARANLRRAGLTPIVLRAEWRSLPYRSGVFDTILAFAAPRPGLWSEIDRVLGPRGKVFMVVPTRHSIISVWYRAKERARPGVFDERGNASALDRPAPTGPIRARSTG